MESERERDKERQRDTKRDKERQRDTKRYKEIQRLTKTDNIFYVYILGLDLILVRTYRTKPYVKTLPHLYLRYSIFREKGVGLRNM